MKTAYINIHTHRPTGHGIELRTAGVHPWEATKEKVNQLEGQLQLLLRPESCVNEAGCFELLVEGNVTQKKADALFLPPQAIGEIGLDGVRGADGELQKEVFAAQLTLAEYYALPVVLHCVRAFAEVMLLLKGYRLPAVIFHGFIGTTQQAHEALRRGYYLSFGERTFASPKTGEAMRATPLDRLFLETDDSPTSIETIYTQAAEVLGCRVEKLQETTTANYERIFNHHG